MAGVDGIADANDLWLEDGLTDSTIGGGSAASMAVEVVLQSVAEEEEEEVAPSLA